MQKIYLRTNPAYNSRRPAEKKKKRGQQVNRAWVPPLYTALPVHDLTPFLNKVKSA